MKKIILLFAMILAVGTVSAADKKLYATFGTPASQATYSESKYTSNASYSNLMGIFAFSNGELANYQTLVIKNLSDFTLASNAFFRLNLLFSDGNSNTVQQMYNGNDKSLTISNWDLNNGVQNSSGETVTETNYTLADVTEIRFGANAASCSVTIKPENVYLVGSSDNAVATPSISTKGSNAKPGNYVWTASSSNLMTVFEFSNGELANYATLSFKFDNNTDGVRCGYYVGDNFTQIGSTYYTAGTKTITLSELNVDLSTVTKISFGGGSNNGQCEIHASDFVLTNNGETLTAIFQTPAGNAKFLGENVYNFKWTGNSDNMLKFTFGENINKYTTLTFALRDLTGDKIRCGYYVGDTFNNFSGTYTADGAYTVDLTGLGIDLSTISNIAFGGSNTSGSTGSCTLDLSEFVLSNEALDRTFTVDRKSTVCLPFDLSESEATAAGTFYTLGSVSDGTLHFTEVADPEAYKPYIFVSKSTRPFASLTKTVASPAGQTCETTVGTGTTYTFHGVLAHQTVPSGAYGWNASSGEFSKASSSGVTIDAFRAYITSTSGARSLNCVFGDEASGISEVSGSKIHVSSDAVYNLQGQRVSENHKGLVIKNGKKVMMK